MTYSLTYVQSFVLVLMGWGGQIRVPDINFIQLTYPLPS
jgi:hypothetical protein